MPDKHGWIKASEQLPDDFGRYLIFYMQGSLSRQFVADFDPSEDRWLNAWPNMKITHWQPLPENPTEKS